MTSPRALLHLLFNGQKAIDVVQTALELGLLEALEPDVAPATSGSKSPPEPRVDARTPHAHVTLGELSERFGLRPSRLYKFLDCLESLGLVVREQDVDALEQARYRSVPGLLEGARTVLGPDSLERDRDGYPWRTLQGRLPEVLRGEHGIASEAFDWPPRTPEQVAGFEASMSAGVGPAIEAFTTHQAKLLPEGGLRLLEVGGGDGTLAVRLLERDPSLTVDVYNLPAVEPLVRKVQASAGLGERLGFVAGDFLERSFPVGYDALSFVRVLHDWPAETARLLLKKAHAALPPGGVVIVCEEFRTPERLAAQLFWTYFLMGMDSCTSRLREVEWYRDAFEQVGFERFEVLPGPFEILVGRKG